MRQVSYMPSSSTFSRLVNEVMEKNSHILLCYPPTHAALCRAMTQNVPVWTCLGVTARRGRQVPFIFIIFAVQGPVSELSHDDGARTVQACGTEWH